MQTMQNISEEINPNPVGGQHSLQTNNIVVGTNQRHINHQQTQ